MYVPDDSHSRKREISRSTWDVWEVLCKCADPNAGIVEARFTTNARLVEATGLVLGTVKNAMTELRKKGWIEERAGRVHLTCGTFLTELRRRKKEEAKRASLHSDAPSLANDASRRPSLHNYAPSLHSDGASLHNDDPIYKDRARGFDQTIDQTSDQTTHTHDLESLPAREAAPIGRACVCKTKHDSEICDAERIRIARNMPGVVAPERYAMTPEARRGTHDAAYLKRQKELEKPGAPHMPERRCDTTCPECFGGQMKVEPGKGARKCPRRMLAAGDSGPPGAVEDAA